MDAVISLMAPGGLGEGLWLADNVPADAACIIDARRDRTTGRLPCLACLSAFLPPEADMQATVTVGCSPKASFGHADRGQPPPHGWDVCEGVFGFPAC